MQSGIVRQEYERLIGEMRSRRIDWINPLAISLLGAISVFFIASAQNYGGGSQWKMQLVWLGLGASVYAFIGTLNYKVLLEKAHILYGLCLLPLFPLALQSLLIDIGSGLRIPLVVTRYGSTRWLDLFFFRFQPSELAKIGALILGASVLSRSPVGTMGESVGTLGKVAIVFGIPMLLIFLQPDLGSTLVFPPIVFALLYVSRLSLRFFLTAFGLFGLAVMVVAVDGYRYYQFTFADDAPAKVSDERYEDHSWLPLRDYQRNRILGFIIPEVIDPRGINETYNQMQSRIAVGSGGLLGKGPGKGTQAQTGYLPSSVAHNDFIFSVLAEETGFVGGATLIALFTLLIGNTLRIAGIARDRFGMLLCVGVAVLFLVHLFINVGMTMGLTPVTGLPLPFVSYGGSFILTCCILMGLVQSVYRFRRDFS